MARLSPVDISAYIYCPELYYKKKSLSLLSKLNIFEQSVRDAIILAEQTSLLKDSFVTPKKISRAWDKVWWPIATANKIKPSKAEELTIQATKKFVDYCKHDFTSMTWPTAGVQIEKYIDIGNSVLVSNADIIKVDFEANHNNITILDLSRKHTDANTIALDPAILSTVWSFMDDRVGEIVYICIDMSEQHKTLKTLSSTFRQDDMERIRKMLYHVVNGIDNNINYRNIWLCSECKNCSNFNYLMKNDIL